MYEISAKIIKPGNPPVLWIKYSEKKMTKTQCELFFSTKMKPGRALECRVKLIEFRCRIMRVGVSLNGQPEE